jgi:hypothetical protein
VAPLVLEQKFYELQQESIMGHWRVAAEANAATTIVEFTPNYFDKAYQPLREMTVHPEASQEFRHVKADNRSQRREYKIRIDQCASRGQTGRPRRQGTAAIVAGNQFGSDATNDSAHETILGLGQENPGIQRLHPPGGTLPSSLQRTTC